MSQQVPMDKPLSDQDREYLLSRGSDQVVAMLDERFGAESSEPVHIEDGEDVLPYKDWTADDLRAELADRKLKATGTKPEMAARLEEDDASKA
jgi:hypothetical protein